MNKVTGEARRSGATSWARRFGLAVSAAVIAGTVVAGATSAAGDESVVGAPIPPKDLIGSDLPVGPVDGDSAGAVVNGQIVNPAPSWIAHLGNCTGTLVYPQWVISAGHCGASSNIFVGGTTYGDGTIAGVQQSFILESNIGNRDLALHKLTQSVPNQPMAMNRNTGLLSQNPWVTAFGYGAQGPNGPSDGLLRTTGWLNVYTRNGSNSAFEYGNSGSSTTTCFGDSGGPLLGDANGGFVLAGVVSYTVPVNGSFCNGRGGGADVSENMGWIDGVVNGNGGPGSGTPLPDPVDTIELRFEHSNKCVDISGASTASGANVQQWDCVAVPQQRFDVLPVGDAFALRATHSGKCLDVFNFGQANGTNVQQWDCSLNAAQQFQWQGSSIVSVVSGKCLDVSGGSTANGANVQIWECVDVGQQRFVGAPVPNQAPVVTSPGGQSGTVGDAVDLQLVASDPDGDVLTFSVSGLPDGLSLDASSGVISGTLSAAGSFSVSIGVSDGVLSDSASFVWTVDAAGPVDTQNPSTPQNLTATVEANGDVTLAWDAASDDVAVTSYQVLRNGVEIGVTATPGFTVPAPALGSHWYQVRARDAAGNEGFKTAPVRVDIAPPDTQTPSTPQNLAATVEANGDVTITWDPATDNVAVVDYQVLRNGVEIGVTAATSFVVPTPATGSHWYQVRARDAAGNEGFKTAPVRVDIAAGDTQNPSTPQNLAATVEANGDVTLTWDAATDNVAVVDYQVLRNGVEIGVAAATSFVVPTPATGSHWYQVRARDAAGNEGFKTAPVRVDIAAGDTQNPSTPQNLAAQVEANGDVTLTWDAATDNVAVVDYQVLRNGVEIGVTAATSFVVPTPATGSHWYQVRARDAAGNESFKTPPVRVDIV